MRDVDCCNKKVYVTKLDPRHVGTDHVPSKICIFALHGTFRQSIGFSIESLRRSSLLTTLIMDSLPPSHSDNEEAILIRDTNVLTQEAERESQLEVK